MQTDIRLKCAHAGAEDQPTMGEPESVPASAQPAGVQTPPHAFLTPQPCFESTALTDLSNRGVGAGILSGGHP